ncbi:outer-membrane lipoprotein carrier protein LolA [Pelagibacteraceae bacterium]|nr:outer-membrane lipoprotein carrier protein LolA [Pelagibacteraceae bacterium]
MFRFLISLILILFPWQISFAETDLIISKIQTGWNNIQTMSGEFSQIDSNGNLENGKFYFSKPYQSKFVYTNKNEDIITNETLLRIVDKKGFQIDSYAIGGNVLKKLLSNNLDIEKEFTIDYAIENEFNYEVQAGVNNDSTLSRVILTFNKNTMELEKWEIFDELDNKTVLEFTKIKKNIFISQNLFVVRYTNN